MKPGMTSLLYANSNADARIYIRLALDIESGEYATYLNVPSTDSFNDSKDDSHGHYFFCEGARHLAHKFATEDFFNRLEKGI